MLNPKPKQTLEGRTLYLPHMPYGGARLMAAAFQSIGVDARPTPRSNERSRELGLKYTSGDECYPEQVTLGDFMRITDEPDFDPAKTAFFMPTANGPCRFGQYAHLQRKVLRENGLEEVLVLSPTSANSYEDIGEQATELMRTGWRAIVANDILQKLLLKTRPYEVNQGETDQLFAESLEELSLVIQQPGVSQRQKLKQMVDAMLLVRDRFRGLPVTDDRDRPLIGVVGEIFCRLNTFSNDDLVRKIEEQGAECWLSDVSEWIWYTNFIQQVNLQDRGKRFSVEMLKIKIKNYIQRSDEQTLLAPFKPDFLGYEEPEVEEVLENSLPYLPWYGALGEMVLNTGKAIYLYGKGADGIVDISPFTCMNGIVSQAIYPVVSREHDNIPIRIFYFDGTQSDLERDIGIFLELAKTYKRRKKRERVYPAGSKA